jgi:hypothetical protein
LDCTHVSKLVLIKQGADSREVQPRMRCHTERGRYMLSSGYWTIQTFRSKVRPTLLDLTSTCIHAQVRSSPSGSNKILVQSPLDYTYPIPHLAARQWKVKVIPQELAMVPL